jgi:hypothetical protein
MMMMMMTMMTMMTMMIYFLIRDRLDSLFLFYFNEELSISGCD